MGWIYDAGAQLLKSVLALIQVVVALVLLAIVWLPVALVVLLLNLVYALATGDSFANIDLLTEPLYWWLHQVQVVFAVKDDFWAIPYAGM
jgi:hypothetical protein